MRVEQGSGVQSHRRAHHAESGAWLKDYVGLRGALKQAQYDQLNEGDWEKSLKALNKAYTDFTKKNGRVLEFTVYDKVTQDEDGREIIEERRRYKNSRVLNMDIESPLVEALEQITEENEIVKGPMLLRRTIKRPEPPVIKTLSDALAVSLDQVGTLNLDHVAKLITDSGTPMTRGEDYQGPGRCNLRSSGRRLADAG
jgi:N12 class adenine-specific DNA methylase